MSRDAPRTFTSPAVPRRGRRWHQSSVDFAGGCGGHEPV